MKKYSAIGKIMNHIRILITGIKCLKDGALKNARRER
jgi:hypothetical protein